MRPGGVAALALLAGCEGLRSTVVSVWPTGYAPAVAAPALPSGTLPPVVDGADAGRPAVPVQLVPVLRGLSQPTDLAVPPGQPGRLLVAEKGGAARLFEVATGRDVGTVFTLPVLTRSEQGLLGLAFHPRFAENGLLFVHASLPGAAGQEQSQVLRVRLAGPPAGPWSVAEGPTLVYAVDQPYPNHNAGVLVFAADGTLLVPYGDGGWRDDPHGHGQDPAGVLGSIVRLDVDTPGPDGRPWSVPAGQPAWSTPGTPPETWAIGLRNPWRAALAPDGRLVVADVGQGAWEEVSIATAGANLGWAQREGRACFPPDAPCAAPAAAGLTEPFAVYGHDEGQSITGGGVAQAPALPALDGQYVFADFVSGRFWAAPLPAPAAGPQPPLAARVALGRFPIMPSTFGRAPDGGLYVADFAKGDVYRLVEAPPGG